MSENNFVLKGGEVDKQQFNTGAQRDSQADKPRYDLISPFAEERIAWIYAKGAERYGERNWEKGMGYSRYLSSAERHLRQFKQGDIDEDHLGQCVWNLMAIMHHQAVGPEGLDDLPKYERVDK